MTSPAKPQYAVIADTLNDINAEGGFSLSVLTDENGLPIATSAGGEDESEVQAAVVAQVQKVVLRVRDHLSMAAPEEIALNDVNGKKLVCRSFEANGNNVVLAVLIPGRNQSYRKLMNRAIRSIQKTWSY
jgi:predicted regulator of Ras-like GTPase activity (Roadblock/LC7/MglB family)